MAILITGGAGFIGAHIAARLLAEGEDVVLADIYTSQVYSAETKKKRVQALLPSRTTIFPTDIRSAEAMLDVVARVKPKTIIHLAAHASVTDSLLHPAKYIETNVMGTLHVLQAAAATGAHVIFASSSTIYSDTGTTAHEGDTPRPLSPYGASKLSAEHLARLWHDLYGLPVAVLRLFSVYGPWGRPDMAPQLFTNAILRRQPCSVTSGAGRDYIYIADVVDAFVKATRQPQPWNVLNIGSGAPTPLTELVEAIASASGREPQLVTTPARPGEMMVTAADITKAREVLGWQPHWSLDAGVHELVEWQMDEALQPS